MKKITAAIIVIFFSANLRSQQYIVRYDMATEDLRYLKVKRPGDTVASPVIDMNRAKRVNLQLVNTAGSYRQEVILQQKEIVPETVVIPGLGSASTSESVSSLIIAAEKKNLNANNLFKNLMNEEVNKNFRIESADKEMLLQLFSKNYSRFHASYEVWKKAFLFEQDCRQLWKELALLRYDLSVTAGKAKTTAQNKMQTVFPGADPNNNAQALPGDIIDPSVQADVVEKNYEALQQVYHTITSERISSALVDSMMNEVGRNMQVFRSSSGKNNPENITEIINRINNLYRQILLDSYTRLTPLNINTRTVMAEIRFAPEIDSATSLITNIKSKDTVTRWIPLYKKEPLRFRNTFGFSFVSYAENRWKYFVRQDSVIDKVGADQFQPVIVTYLHFYAPRDRGFRWGGSFGAGFPLSGENKQLNLMLGLSTFLGKGDPVCLTAGVSGTQVKKLYGVKLGDKVDSEGFTIQYNNVYRAGYFIALTFNPSALNRKE